MGWLDSVVSGLGSLFGGKSALGGIVSSVITGYALNKVQQSISKTSDSATRGTHTVVPTDFGQLLTMPANQDNPIPVLYGTAYVPGVITDAVMSPDRQTMTYVITLCENTGNTIAGEPSSISFTDIFWNENKVYFYEDGVTARYTQDQDGNIDTNIDSLVKIYCFSRGSSGSIYPSGNSGLTNWAYQLVPNWTSAHTMDDLAFMVVQVKYDKTKGVTGLPKILVKMKNTMNQPGDCMYDYMTNTRYGCGILPQDIYL